MSLYKLKASDARQTTISHVFSKTVKKPSVPKVELTPLGAILPDKKLTSDNPRIQTFYDSLSLREVIAHSIAVDKLGTSYDVTRTHGFLKWSKANPA